MSIWQSYLIIYVYIIIDDGQISRHLKTIIHAVNLDTLHHREAQAIHPFLSPMCFL